jgi:hypothetical protein
VVATTFIGDGLTNAGRAALAEEARRVRDDLETAQVGVTSLPIERGLYLVAVFGRSVMTGELAPLRRVLT